MTYVLPSVPSEIVSLEVCECQCYLLCFVIFAVHQGRLDVVVVVVGSPETKCNKLGIF